MKTAKSLTIIIIAALGLPGIALANSGQAPAAIKTDSVKTEVRKAVLKLFKMDCSTCAAQIEAKLSSLKGISEATADFDKAEAYIIYDPARITVNKMIEEIRAIDFDAKAGDINSFPKSEIKELKAERDNKKLAALIQIEKEDEKLGIKVISQGEDINLQDNLDNNKLTVFDFYADWCDHCIELGENLKKLISVNPDLFVVKKIHLPGEAKDTFKLPVVKKYMKEEYGFPYIRIYDARGRMLYEGGDFAKIKQILNKNSGKA
jgi:copper chaperone CopZ